MLFTDFLKDNKNSANSNFYNFGLHGCCFKRERKCWFRFVLRKIFLYYYTNTRKYGTILYIKKQIFIYNFIWAVPVR